MKERIVGLNPLPDPPISPHPNGVTPTGLAAPQSRLRARQHDLAALRHRANRLDRLPEAAAGRDIRYLEARLRSALLIDRASQPLTEVAFGLCVTITGANGSQTTDQITGEDEADVRPHRIAPQSLLAPLAPLARALLGAQVGDRTIWRKPPGPVTLAIPGVGLADDPQP